MVIFCLEYDIYFIHKEETHLALLAKKNVREYNYSLQNGDLARIHVCGGRY